MSKLVVIGGGIAGLSAALATSRAGFEVVLLEKNAEVGGKLHERRLGSYRFDAGPSILTLRPYIEAALGPEAAHLTWKPLSPTTTYYFLDAAQPLPLPSNLEAQQALIQARYGLGARWHRFMKYAKTLYERAAPVFLELPIHEVGTLVQSKRFWRHLPYVFFLDSFRTMHQASRAYLEHPHLVHIADRYATFVGGDPFRLPATYHLIAWAANTVYDLAGGLYQLAKAFRLAIEKAGGRILTQTEAHAIRHSKGRVIGVDTSTGFIEASVVICATDWLFAQSVLLKRPLKPRETSLSGLVFLWGVASKSPFSHHNILFSADYAAEFGQLAARQIPKDPTVYISISNRTNPSDSPKGCENWFVMLNVPALGNSWPAEATQVLRQRAIRRIRAAWPDFSERLIEEELALTPHTWEMLHNATGGSLYGQAPHGLVGAFLRPANRDPLLRGLYYASGTAHPGGGVPLAILSGQIAAHLATKTLS